MKVCVGTFHMCAYEVLCIKTPVSYLLQYATDAHHCRLTNLTFSALNATMLQKGSNFMTFAPWISTSQYHDCFSCLYDGSCVCYRVDMVLHNTAPWSKSSCGIRAVCNREDSKKQATILGNCYLYVQNRAGMLLSLAQHNDWKHCIHSSVEVKRKEKCPPTSSKLSPFHAD